MTPKPPVSLVLKAIEIYLSLAYEGREPSVEVRGRVRALAALGEEGFFESQNIEKHPDRPGVMRIRLGNAWYPHMKLSLDPRPDGEGYLFRADTHDRHCCPPAGSREHGEFMALMDRNQRLAEAIEAAWEEAGVGTFKGYLAADLRRRMAGG